MPGAQCTAIKIDGDECTMPAEAGREVCRYHDPMRQIAAEMGKRSQVVQAANREAREAARPKPGDLRTVEQIQKFLEWSIDCGDTTMLRAAPGIAKAALECIDIGRLEKENAELRKLLADAGALKVVA